MRRIGAVVVGLVLLAAACGDVNISPTAPAAPFFTGSGLGVRNLEITGSLTAEDGTVVEARVLFDGKELAGSNVVCPLPAGCTRLDLKATTTSPAGRHTVSFQVLRQPSETTTYLAQTKVRITRDGLTFVLPFSPDPIRAALRAGESITFEFDLID